MTTYFSSHTPEQASNQQPSASQLSPLTSSKNLVPLTLSVNHVIWVGILPTLATLTSDDTGINLFFPTTSVAFSVTGGEKTFREEVRRDEGKQAGEGENGEWAEVLGTVAWAVEERSILVVCRLSIRHGARETGDQSEKRFPTRFSRWTNSAHPFSGAQGVRRLTAATGHSLPRRPLTKGQRARTPSYKG